MTDRDDGLGFLTAISLQNYRGIGDEEELLLNLSRFNIFVGANNAGKLTVLSAIFRHMNVGPYANGKDAELDPLESHQHGRRPPELGFGIYADTAIEALLSKAQPANRNFVQATVEAAIKALCDENDLLWFKSELPVREMYKLRTKSVEHILQITPINVWNNLQGTFSNTTGEGYEHIV